MRPGVLALRAREDVHHREAHEGVARDAKTRAHVEAGIGRRGDGVRDDADRQVERGAKRRGAIFRRRPDLMRQPLGEAPVLRKSRRLPHPTADAIGRRNVARPQQRAYHAIRVWLAKKIDVLERAAEVERLARRAFQVGRDVDGRDGRVSRLQGRQIVGRRAPEPKRAGKRAEGERRPRRRPGGGILREGIRPFNVVAGPAPPANRQARAIPDVLQAPAPQRPARRAQRCAEARFALARGARRADRSRKRQPCIRFDRHAVRVRFHAVLAPSATDRPIRACPAALPPLQNEDPAPAPHRQRRCVGEAVDAAEDVATEDVIFDELIGQLEHQA